MQRNKTYPYDDRQHDLPIKINICSDWYFDLWMGFDKIPSDSDSPKLKIVIIGDRGKIAKSYTRERLNSEGISYLSIGNIPCEKYALGILGASDRIHDYWPETVNGIDPEGTIFDGVTGEKLVYDSETVVGRRYYFLIRDGKDLFNNVGNAHISFREICRQTVTHKRREQWFVYEIIANDFHEDPVNFFLAFHCRLTDTPVS